jgi:hypothetical protein
MKNLVIILFAALSAISVNAQTSWSFEMSVDDFTDEVTPLAGNFGKGQDFPYDNPVILVSRNNGKYRISLGNAGYWIQGDFISSRIRVDKNETFNNSFKVYGHEYWLFIESGDLSKQSRLDMEELISQMMEGSTLRMYFYQTGLSSAQVEFSLKGAKESINSVIKTSPIELKYNSPAHKESIKRIREANDKVLKESRNI